ncbi:cell filamentation protein Fic [Spirochaetia bacterium]|nr:cell filamentation protein Fic [Spirochaetia bacterium]
MGKVYKYIDPDYNYTDPKTGVLWNLGNIADNDTLIFFESTAVTKRTKELKKSPVTIKDSAALFAIHRYLFQDVYTWAGQKRKVEISKGGKQFFPLDHFDTAFVYIDNLIAEYRSIDKKDSDKIAGKLAEVLDTVNYLHPFREGNGRTQREFLRVLALEKGFSLNLNPADNADVYERYMSGTIDADVGKLADLILELMRGVGDE